MTIRLMPLQPGFLSVSALKLCSALPQGKRPSIRRTAGHGKTFVARILAEALTSDPSQRRIVQFHPAYQYEDFIQGIRPTLDGGRLQYEMHRGVLLTMAARASEQPRSRFVLILDELNREMSRVFW